MRDTLVNQRIRRLTAVALLVALPGCSTWHDLRQVTPAPPAKGHLRVTLRNDQRVELWDVHVTADSLIGSQDGTFHEHRRAFSVSEIAKVEVPRLDAGKSILYAVGAGVGLFLLVHALVDLLKRVDLGSSWWPSGTWW